MKNMKNKKGVVEVITTIVILLVVALGFVAVVFVGLQINDSLGDKFQELDPTNTSYAPMGDMIEKTVVSADYIFLALFAFLFIAIIITSFLFFSHPVFVVIYIILAVGSLIVSVPLANSYEKVTDLNAFAEATSRLPITDWILLHLPLVTLGIIIISIIVIYAKSQSNYAFSGGGMSGM